MFTGAELARATAYRRAIDTARFVVGCALSRLALGELLSLPPGDVPLLRDCADCGQPHGRPRLADDSAHVSVSHSGEHVVVAVTRAAPLGVDIEQHKPQSVDLAEAVLTETEQAGFSALPKTERVAGFFRYWTRKEAVLKATGDGLRVPMTAIEVSAPHSPAALLRFDGRPTLRLRLADLSVDAEHSAAIAVETTDPPTMTHVDGRVLLAAVS